MIVWEFSSVTSAVTTNEHRGERRWFLIGLSVPAALLCLRKLCGYCTAICIESRSFLVSGCSGNCTYTRECACCRNMVIHLGEVVLVAMISFLCERVWLTLARGDQLAQIAVYEHAPGVRAAAVAFVFGY